MASQINPVQRIGSVLAEKSVSAPAVASVSPRADGLTFSKHLNDRINRRNLDMNPERMGRLSDAVDRAADKGARDSVVLLDNLALLVNVPSRTVVTAMETEKMKHGVFTNIDAVVVG